MDYAIETKELSKKFSAGSFFRRKKTSALDKVNLKVSRGEIFVLLGENGAGKSTLLKIICGLILPTSGTVLINGKNIFDGAPQFKKDIGFVSGEERSFYWRLTGRQNLEFFGSLCGLSNFRIKERIENVARLLEIKEEINKQFRYFSAGAKQRLSLARALLHEPSIIFMDEPTRSLDYFAQKKIIAFIRDKLVKEEKKTLFITTHDLAQAESLADRLAIIAEGRIKGCGTPLELKCRLNKKDLADLFREVTGRGDSDALA